MASNFREKKDYEAITGGDFKMKSKDAEEKKEDDFKMKSKDAEKDEDVIDDYDGLTEVMGKVGKFHLLSYFALYMSVTPHCHQMFANKWLTFETPFWCARPPTLTSLDPDLWVNVSSPLDANGEPDRCRVFDVEFDPENLQRPDEDTKTRECVKFEYDTSEFQETAIHRWDLVCSKKLIPRYVQTIFFVGNFIGVILSGLVADTFGRKVGYCSYVTIWIISGVIGSQVGNLYIWILTRFICGAMSLGYMNIISTYATELTSGKWRAMQGYFFSANYWDGGVILLGGLVYLCRNMRTLELIIALSNLPFLLAWIFMKESPRWLLSKGRKAEATSIITSVCEMNGRPTEKVKEFVDNFQISEEQQRGNIVDLFRTPKIRRNSLLMCLCWLSFSMGYFGLFYNIPPLDWSPFLVFIIPAIPSMPTNFVEPFLENILGRKFMLTGSLLAAGVMLFLTTAFPKDHWGIIVCAWVGAYFCSISFGAGYTYTKELYPTVLRSTALGTASAAARIGSILSPIIALSASIHQVLPLVMYGATMFAAGLGSVWIWPETKKIHLFYTLEECEKAAATTNSWTHCGSRRRTGKVGTTDD